MLKALVGQAKAPPPFFGKQPFFFSNASINHPTHISLDALLACAVYRKNTPQYAFRRNTSTMEQLMYLAWEGYFRSAYIQTLFDTYYRTRNIASTNLQVDCLLAFDHSKFPPPQIYDVQDRNELSLRQWVWRCREQGITHTKAMRTTMRRSKIVHDGC